MTAEVIHNEALTFLGGEPDAKYDFVYIDPPYYCQRDFSEFNDKWSGVDEYMAMLSPVISHAHRVLKPHGNICVHVDWHAAHHVRLCLDRAFGESNFRNEIVWCYASGGASKRHFSRKHDNLFVYAKEKFSKAFDLGQLVDTRERRRIVGDFTLRWEVACSSSTT